MDIGMAEVLWTVAVVGSVAWIGLGVRYMWVTCPWRRCNQWGNRRVSRY